MSPLVYRTVGEEGFDAVQPLWEKLRAYHSHLFRRFGGETPPFDFEPRKRELLAKAAAGKLRIELVRVASGAVDIGYCISTVSADGAGEVDSMFVEETFRGRGIGREFLRHALAWFYSEGTSSKVITVAFANERALALYRQFGFHPRTILLQQGHDNASCALENTTEQTKALRRASTEDLPRLVALMEEFYAEAAFPLNRRRAAEAFAVLLAEPQLGQVWFIRSKSQDVGHVIITFCFSMEYGGPIAFVDDLFIRRPFRRAGLGTAALKEVRDICAARGLRACFVETGPDNTAALALYRRVGFVNTDRELLALSLADATHVDSACPKCVSAT